MQRLSVGSPGSRPSLDGAPAAAADEADEKATGKATRAAAPDKSIHLVPLLTLLCFLVLFLFSHDPASSPAIADSPPVLAVTARSLEATADTTPSVARGVAHQRPKADPTPRDGAESGNGRAKAGPRPRKQLAVGTYGPGPQRTSLSLDPTVPRRRWSLNGRERSSSRGLWKLD